MSTPLTTDAIVSATEQRGRAWAASLPTDAELWMFTTVLSAVVALGMWYLRWTVHWAGVLQFLTCLTLLGTLGAFYHRSGRSEALARISFALALLLAMAFACQASTYLFATTGMPFRDAELRAADAVFGFSWTTWHSWVRAHQGLHRVLALVYPWHLAETAVAVLTLAHFSERRVAAFMRAFALAFLASLIGLVLVPALGNIPEARSVPVRWALQLGDFDTFDVFQTTGLISMPSFHAVLAVLVPIACWPFRRFRWWIVALNLVMLVATVSEGGHYLVDVIAGAALALATARAAGMFELARRELRSA
jgi:membrane-associated phospholipid phosphatase